MPTPSTTHDLSFELTPKQRELFFATAPLRLGVGGVRSGKTFCALMFGLINYVTRFPKCDILVLRRTFRELESGAITDLRAFAQVNGRPIFTWHDSKHIATFPGCESRIFFGSCTHNLERDIQQYLGQGYPFILLDECAQFSPDAFELLQSRNTINPRCEPNPQTGEMPSPVIWGCTNPIGPYWLYYKTLFVDCKPVSTDGARREPDGTWTVADAGERRIVYDPKRYACSHSTVMDNPFVLQRDPGIIARLNSLPAAKRDKFLFGLMDRVEGQYYECFSPEHHVVNLRLDPSAIVWQPYQPVWAGWDWGMAHHNAIYLFTKALVRSTVTGTYRMKTVCFAELVTNETAQGAIVSMLLTKLKLPGTSLPVKLSAAYFSHEKFSRQMEQSTPADVLSRLLRDAGQCPVSPATRNRIGRASFVYNMLQKGDLVILDSCPEIIAALPSLQRDPDQLDDVLKVDNKADDCYDGFSYGLFGQLGTRPKPQEQRDRERIQAIADPFARHMAQFKATMDRNAIQTPTRFEWEKRLRLPDGKTLR